MQPSPSPDPRQFHLASRHGQRRGIVTQQEILDLLSRGDIHPQDLLWQKGMPAWDTVENHLGCPPPLPDSARPPEATPPPLPVRPPVSTATPASPPLPTPPPLPWQTAPTGPAASTQPAAPGRPRAKAAQALAWVILLGGLIAGAAHLLTSSPTAQRPAASPATSSAPLPQPASESSWLKNAVEKAVESHTQDAARDPHSEGARLFRQAQAAMAQHSSTPPYQDPRIVQLLTQAATQDHSEAAYLLAQHHAAAPADPASPRTPAQQEVHWLMQAATQQHPAAAHRLGSLFQKGGPATPQDFAQANVWLRNAANLGHADAQFTLAENCALGRGMQADAGQATHWLQTAAAQGHLEAMHYLANQLTRGHAHLPADPPRAAQLYRTAADCGYGPSQDRLAFAYSSGLYGLPRDAALALPYFQKAAAQGITTSQVHLGLAHLAGQGVPVSIPQAEYWLTKAGEAGDADGWLHLGHLHAQGLAGAPRQPMLALRYYRRGADLQNVACLYAYAASYLPPANPQPTALDYTIALPVLKDAARLGSGPAFHLLAHSAANGEGLPQDLPLARRLHAAAILCGEKGDLIPLSRSHLIPTSPGTGVDPTPTLLYLETAIQLGVTGVSHPTFARTLREKFTPAELAGVDQQIARLVHHLQSRPAPPPFQALLAQVPLPNSPAPDQPARDLAKLPPAHDPLRLLQDAAQGQPTPQGHPSAPASLTTTATKAPSTPQAPPAAQAKPTPESPPTPTSLTKSTTPEKPTDQDTPSPQGTPAPPAHATRPLHQRIIEGQTFTDTLTRWKKVELEGLCTLRIPPSMELPAGLFKEVHDSLLIKQLPDTDTPHKPLIIQQKGLNALDPKAQNQYARILVLVAHPADPKIPPASQPLTAQHLADLDDTIHESFRLQNVRLLDYTPAALTRVEGREAIEVHFRRQQGSRPPVLVHQYLYRIGTRQILVILSHRESEEPLWELDQFKSLATLEFLEP